VVWVCIDCIQLFSYSAIQLFGYSADQAWQHMAARLGRRRQLVGRKEMQQQAVPACQIAGVQHKRRLAVLEHLLLDKFAAPLKLPCVQREALDAVAPNDCAVNEEAPLKLRHVREVALAVHRLENVDASVLRSSAREMPLPLIAIALHPLHLRNAHL